MLTILAAAALALAGSGFFVFAHAEDTPSRMILAANAPKTTAVKDSAAVLQNSPALSLSGRVARTDRLKPSSIMYHSFWLPGWGQLDNGRKKKAALFIAAEVFFIGGYLFEQHSLNVSNGTEFERDQIRTERNSYIIYWLGAKLFGMVDAYVDAQLRNYDVEDVTPAGLKKAE